MTVGTATAGNTPGQSWLGKVGRVLYVLFVLLVAFILYKAFFKPDDPHNHLWWFLSTGWLFLAGLVFILFMSDADKRKFGLFVFVNVVLTIIFAAFIQNQLVTNRGLIRAVQDNAFFSFLLGGFVETVIWATFLGLLAALLISILLLSVVAYVAAIYILALHEVDGVSRGDAIRYVLATTLGVNLPFIAVENGQALTTKDSGVLTSVGGPGKLIVKQGNVVVLEKGGKITRVVNAGVTRLRPKEKIRNVFNLGRQTNPAEIEHVLTRDRIPLTIKMAIAFQIEPAAKAEERPESHVPPDGEALTEKLDDELYQVYAGTIKKAVLMSQATTFAKRDIEKCEEKSCQDVLETTWTKVGGSVPEGDLRDHILSHRFDELFELVDSGSGEKPDVRVKKRKIYEIEQAILEAIKPVRARALGVLVHGVDIGEIQFPKEAGDLLISHWGAPWTQQVQLIEAETKAQGALQVKVSEAQGKLEATRLEAQGELEIADLKAQAIVINARAEAQKQVMEGRSRAEARAAFFQCIVESLQVDGRPPDRELTLAILQEIARTFASVNDIETFMRVFGRINLRQSFPIESRNGTEVNE